jgi:SAM-dependent methyltransferase
LRRRDHERDDEQQGGQVVQDEGDGVSDHRRRPTMQASARTCRRRFELEETMAAAPDPFADFKAAQREGWSAFTPVEVFTTIPAAKLVKFAEVAEGQRVLDVGCGTGVVAITAARRGAKASGLDLTPTLIERARHNASVAGVDVDFVEGDAEALPYPDASFDFVLSQFGHMFAPRPAVALQEMLRVLKVGGRIAFSTWPPEHFTGQMFTFIARYLPPPPPGVDPPPPPASWGDPNVVRERLGRSVSNLRFARDALLAPMLSLQHFRIFQEATIGPLARVVAALQGDPVKLAQLRAEFESLAVDAFEDNAVNMPFLMTRATKSA